MFAFVLSGGGSLGALQAGALEVLLERGLKPDLIVGTSAGALNAIFLAADPTPEGARSLQRVWAEAQPARLGPPGLFTMAGRFMFGRESLFANERLREFLARGLPAGLTTFGEVFDRTGVRAFALAAGLGSGQVRAFGDRREDRLLDGAMASTALPPYYPPWAVGDERYLDGGVLSNLPLRAAVERGACEALVMDLHQAFPHMAGSSMRDIGTLAISIMIAEQTRQQLEEARRQAIRLHPVSFVAGTVPILDFSRVEELVQVGRVAAEDFLRHNPSPLPSGPTWRYRIRHLFRRAPKDRWADN